MRPNGSRGINHIPASVGHLELQPGLDDIQRPSRKRMPDFRVGDENSHLCWAAGSIRTLRKQLNGQDWPARPDFGDLGNVSFSGEPLVHKHHLPSGSRQAQHFGHIVVRREDAMIVNETLRVARRIVSSDFMHVAVLTLQVPARVGMPRSILPVVVLILELYEPPAVLLLTNVLLVAGAAEFRSLRRLHIVVVVMLFRM